MEQITTVGVDLAKNVFQLAGADQLGEVIYEERLKSREALRELFAQLPESVEVLMETGPGAQAWARTLRARGIAVRILPAQRVAEHRSGAKNDRNDVLAILRAGRDTAIHAVPVEAVELLPMPDFHPAPAAWNPARDPLRGRSPARPRRRPPPALPRQTGRSILISGTSSRFTFAHGTPERYT